MLWSPCDELQKTYVGEKVIHEPDKVLMPGFIDGHMHTGHGILRGVAQDISNRMMEGMAPFEAQRSSEAKTWGSKLAIAEAVMNGTTTIGDDGSDMEGACRFIQKSERAAMCLSASGKQFPAPIRRANCMSSIQAWGNGR